MLIITLMMSGFIGFTIFKTQGPSGHHHLDTQGGKLTPLCPKPKLHFPFNPNPSSFILYFV